MNLLKDTPCTFRYGLYHTSDKKVIIVFLESKEEINDYSSTILETLYENAIFLNYKINNNETVKVTCSDNQITMKQFDTDIINYCKKYGNTTNEIRVINATPSHKVLFGVDVFTTIVNNTKELYMELGDSGFHVGSSDFNTLDKFTIQTGKLYPQTTVNLYVKQLSVMNLEITVANKDEDFHAFNFIVSSIANIIYLKLYSTITTVITAGSKEGDNISNAKLISNYMEFYGEEKVEDNNKERLGIFGFKSALIGEIQVNEEVVVGNILKVDKLVSFTLNKFHRKINSMSDGYGVCIYRVANVNLSDLYYEIDKDSDIPKEVSIVHFLKDTDSGFHKKIFLYNSSINNVTDNKITLMSLEETTVENIYISDCTIGNGITMIKKHDDTEILRMTFNNIVIDIIDDIIFNNVDRFYFTNCTFTTLGSINITSSFISINGGMWKFKKCKFGDNNFISHDVNIQNVEFHGDNLDILNDRTNSLDGKLFDNDSKFDVENINISGYQTSLANTVLYSKTFKCSCDKTLTLTRTSIDIKENAEIIANCSLSGILMAISENSENKLNLKIEDKEKFLSTNTLDIISIGGESPIIKCTTNNTLKVKLINDSNDLFYINYLSDYNSEQNSRITFVPLFDKPIDYKVITDTEKLINIVKTKSSDNNDIIFEVNKK